MITHHEGIVLKNYQPKKQKVTLLDKNLGKIECFAPYRTRELCVGSIVSYFPIKCIQLYEFADLEILEIPLDVARHEFHFFHHVLELSYYFLPLELPAEVIFSMVRFLVHSFAKISTDIQKKLFLLRFFVQLGVYPQEGFEGESSFHYLLSQPIDDMLVQRVHIADQMLERWIVSCIETHPQRAQFKTMMLG